MRHVFVAIAAAFLCASASAAVPGAINCAKATAPDERTVCKSYDLGQLDAELATQYVTLKGFMMMGARGAMIDDQRDWLTQRAACKTDAACLTRVYQTRIDALQKELERIKSFGPF